MKKILIAGGGVGGVVAAKRLLERLGDKAEITMVSDQDYYSFPPFFTNVALGDMEPQETSLPLSRLVERGARVVKARITGFQPENRKVLTDSGELTYDYLLASLGIEYDMKAYGLEAGVHNFTLDGAMKMRDALASFKGGKVVVFTPSPMYRCGIYPFEIANMLVETFAKKGLREKSSVTLVHPFKRPLEPLGEEAIKITEESFQEHGVQYVGGARPVGVDSSRKVVEVEGESFPYDLLVTVPPITMPSPFKGSGLTANTPVGEWTAVDPATGRNPRYDDVFLPGEHSMPFLGLPTAGVPVHFTSLASASAIEAEVVGQSVEPGQISAMVCAMDYGDRGVVINCDVTGGKRGLAWTGDHYQFLDEGLRWTGSCYSVLTSPLGRYVKDMFYRSFLLTSM